MRFRDSVVRITRASSGVGAEMAIPIAAEDAHLVVSSRDQDALMRIGAKFNGAGETMVLPLDITDEEILFAAVQRVLSRFNRVDILINNAGLAQRTPISETPLNVYRQIMDVIFFGPIMLTKTLLRKISDRAAGQIVCVTSVAGK